MGTFEHAWNSDGEKPCGQFMHGQFWPLCCLLQAVNRNDRANRVANNGSTRIGFYCPSRSQETQYSWYEAGTYIHTYKQIIHLPALCFGNIITVGFVFLANLPAEGEGTGRFGFDKIGKGVVGVKDDLLWAQCLLGRVWWLLPRLWTARHGLGLAASSWRRAPLSDASCL